jgi:hypothetical protein
MRNCSGKFICLFSIVCHLSVAPLLAEDLPSEVSNAASPTLAPVPFTSNPTIDAEPMDPARVKALSEFLALPLQRQRRTALPSIICKSVVTQPTPSANQVDIPLALVESDVAAELTFKKPRDDQEPNPATANYLIDFSLDSVLLRSSAPRYPSQAQGLPIYFESETTKTIWLEAKNEMSVLFLVPPVRDCGFQFVVACPRTYSKARSLDDSHLTISGVRYHAAAKADGLFQAPKGGTGRIRATLLASSRLVLPAQSFSEDTSAETPNTSIKLRRESNPWKSLLPFNATSVPFADALEARLEFGTTSSVARTVRSRATLDVSPIELKTPQRIDIESSEVSLPPGSCFAISRRKETHY